MRLRALVLALIGGVSPLCVDAQPVRKTPIVGYVGLPHEPSESRWQDGFVRGLRELGYRPGDTIVVQARTYTTRDELRTVIEGFAQEKIDIIFVGQPFVALTARQVTRDIPIVCGSCGDPTENGLATSLARPGGNVTGLASLSAELIGKRLELVKEMLPGIASVAVLVFPTNPGTRATVRELDVAARRLGLEIERHEIRGAADFDGAIRAAARSGVGAIVLQDDPLLRSVGTQLAELALKHRLPLSAACWRSSRPVGSWRTDPIVSICTGAPPGSWTRS